MGPTVRRLVVFVALTTVSPWAAAARQAQPEAAQTEEAAALTRARLVERIASELGQIASDARGIDDPDLKLSCRLQAAGLLWTREPDHARDIYSEAFDGLLPSQSATSEERTRAFRLLDELFSNVARHDPALAERFAARLALVPPAADDGSADGSPTRADILANAAIEALPGDPARAAAMGRIALGDGITPSFMRLLVVLHGVDAARADGLFVAALSGLARNPSPRIADIQLLGFYVSGNGMSQLDGVPTDAMRAYLESAFRLVSLTPVDSRDASAAYFLGRQLAPAFARYAPDRMAELDGRLALLAHSEALQQTTPAVDRSSDASSGDSADAARVRAATEAIDREDYKTAHSEAAAIRDDDLQSRVYAQAALHLVKQRRLDEAAREINRVPDPARRASLLIQLAYAAHSRGDIAYAVDALSSAGREAAKEQDAGPRLQALFSVASAFVDVDALRAFDAMQGAIDGVNKATRAVDAPGPDRRSLAPTSFNFDATLARLARVDFDRSFSLAQQFDPIGHRLLAEIAVCRGGLASAGFREVAEDLDDEDPVSSS